jgi:hypothetical protein
MISIQKAITFQVISGLTVQEFGNIYDKMDNKKIWQT